MRIEKRHVKKISVGRELQHGGEYDYFATLTLKGSVRKLRISGEVILDIRKAYRSFDEGAMIVTEYYKEVDRRRKLEDKMKSSSFRRFLDHCSDSGEFAITIRRKK